MNAITPAFGCTTGGVDFAVALNRVLGLVEQPLPAEQVPLDACAGRVLAETVVAPLDLPPFVQSAMDGYAVRTDDLVPGGALPIAGRTVAGEPPMVLTAGTAHRILTGAALPVGADAVIAQEHADRAGDMLHLGAVPPPGTNIRYHGEDIRRGAELIPAGMLLDWRHLAVLAGQGIAAARVRQRPRVAVLSSGRELRVAGERLAAGQVHDSNLPMLMALLTAWGASVHPVPAIADDAAAMRAALSQAAEQADLVLTTAGVSVGDEDHVRDALRDLGGNLPVLKVAMKPGKPLAAGRLGRAVFVGLPGNPQAALAGAVGFVRPLLARMTGTAVQAPLHVQAGFAMRRRPGRAEFTLARLVQRGPSLWALRAGPDGSGRLAPLLAATGFVFLPDSVAEVGAGDSVKFIPFMPSPITAA